MSKEGGQKLKAFSPLTGLTSEKSDINITTSVSVEAWDEEAVRAQCKKSVETCEGFLAEHRRPDAEPGQALYDLCLAEYAVQKHLLAADCFSSREELVAELTRLLREPVTLPLLP